MQVLSPDVLGLVLERTTDARAFLTLGTLSRDACILARDLSPRLDLWIAYFIVGGDYISPLQVDESCLPAGTVKRLRRLFPRIRFTPCVRNVPPSMIFRVLLAVERASIDLCDLSFNEVEGEIHNMPWQREARYSPKYPGARSVDIHVYADREGTSLTPFDTCLSYISAVLWGKTEPGFCVRVHAHARGGLRDVHVMTIPGNMVVTDGVPGEWMFVDHNIVAMLPDTTLSLGFPDFPR